MFPGRGHGYGGYGGGGYGRSPDSPYWRSLMLLANIAAAFCSFILGQVMYNNTETAMSNILIATYGSADFGLFIYWLFCYCVIFTVARLSIIALFAALAMVSMRLAFFAL